MTLLTQAGIWQRFTRISFKKPSSNYKAYGHVMYTYSDVASVIHINFLKHLCRLLDAFSLLAWQDSNTNVSFLEKIFWEKMWNKELGKSWPPYPLCPLVANNSEYRGPERERAWVCMAIITRLIWRDYPDCWFLFSGLFMLFTLRNNCLKNPNTSPPLPPPN